MKTFVSLVIEHPKPVDDLAEKIAQRAYVLTGVENVEVVDQQKEYWLMKTFVSLVIEHPKPVDDLAEKIAQRAYVLTGVENVEVLSAFPSLPDPVVQHTNGHAQ